jgi:hypothetical protein
VGSTLHGTSVEGCAYLWIACPPKIKAWHRDYGIRGFIKLETLPQYFKDCVFIYVGWKDPSPGIPWETKEEVRLRLSEDDTFCQSKLGTQPSVIEIDMSAADLSLGGSDDMWNFEWLSSQKKFGA